MALASSVAPEQSRPADYGMLVPESKSWSQRQFLGCEPGTCGYLITHWSLQKSGLLPLLPHHPQKPTHPSKGRNKEPEVLPTYTPSSQRKQQTSRVKGGYSVNYSFLPLEKERKEEVQPIQSGSLQKGPQFTH